MTDKYTDNFTVEMNEWENLKGGAFWLPSAATYAEDTSILIGVRGESKNSLF
jgi:hypothetical protein